MATEHSDLEMAPESSVESETHNDSIEFTTEHEKTKESFSDGNGDVITPNNNDSNLSEQPEKTKESFSDGECSDLEMAPECSDLVIAQSHWLNLKLIMILLNSPQNMKKLRNLSVIEMEMLQH